MRAQLALAGVLFAWTASASAQPTTPAQCQPALDSDEYGTCPDGMANCQKWQVSRAAFEYKQVFCAGRNGTDFTALATKFPVDVLICASQGPGRYAVGETIKKDIETGQCILEVGVIGIDLQSQRGTWSGALYVRANAKP